MTRTLKHLMDTLTPEQRMIHELEEEIIKLKNESVNQRVQLNKLDSELWSTNETVKRMYDDLNETQEVLKDYFKKLSNL